MKSSATGSSSNKSGSSDIVKSLLFPTYTDAGSNDTFRAKNEDQTEDHKESTSAENVFQNNVENNSERSSSSSSNHNQWGSSGKFSRTNNSEDPSRSKNTSESDSRTGYMTPQTLQNDTEVSSESNRGESSPNYTEEIFEKNSKIDGNNSSLNVSTGVASNSGVFGCEFLQEETVEYEDDKGMSLVNSVAATVGGKSISSSKSTHEKNNSMENRVDIPSNEQNAKTKYKALNSEKQTITEVEEENAEVEEDCDSNESIMGSEHQSIAFSDSSSRFAGTVVGTDCAVAPYQRKKNFMQNRNKGGITEEMLRAMEEEHEEEHASNDNIKLSTRLNSSKNDHIITSKLNVQQKLSSSSFDKIDSHSKEENETGSQRYTNDGLNNISSTLALPALDIPDKSSPELGSKKNLSIPQQVPSTPVTSTKSHSSLLFSAPLNSETMTPNRFDIKKYGKPLQYQGILSPLQRARKCLSVDLNDIESSVALSNHATFTNTRESRQHLKPRYLHTDERVGSRIKASNSWDVGGNGMRNGQPSPRHQNTWKPSRNSAFTQFRGELGSAMKFRQGNTFYKSNDNSKRLIKSDDFSPAVMNDRKAVPLLNSQRVEIERADAIDILACLVERSIAFDHEHSNEMESSQKEKTKIEKKESSTTPTMSADKNSNGSINSTIEALRKISQNYSSSDDQDDGFPDHETRLQVLDTLLHSHTYALEMKRAALSALTWLKTVKKDTIPYEGSKSDTDLQLKLFNAEKRSFERDEYIQSLNDELSKCKAEIGRLKSSSRAEMLFASPNRSILDYADDDESSVSSSSQKEDFKVLEDALQDVTAVEKIEDITQDETMEEHEPVFHQQSDEKSDSQLDKVGNKNDSNSVTSESESSIENEKNGDLGDVDIITEWCSLSQLSPPPDHDLHSPIVESLLSQWTSEPGMHESLINWLEQVMKGFDPSHIPPLLIANLDTEVRDGFAMHIIPLLLRRSDVNVEVKTRSKRTTTHDISVVVTKTYDGVGYEVMNENINRSNNKHIMAFKASSGGGAVLDTGVNKGIGNFWRSGNSNSAPSEGNFSISSSAVTSLISNREENNPSSKIGSPQQLRRNTKLSTPRANFSTEYVEDHHGTQKNTASNSGIMGAIGDAFGGLLSRRATTKQQTTPQQIQSPTFDSSPTYSSLNSVSSSPPEDDDHPYHRVVSAPPGRIGVTFVQFRGHAMVSDVAPDSPLSGWIFPSDILIAIDEVPVSGMRVRDIVKVLTARVERQRALRMISTHAMEELTQPNLMD